MTIDVNGQTLQMGEIEYNLANPNPKFEKNTTPSILYSAPPFLSLCVYWSKGHPGKLSKLKKVAAEHMVGTFQKSCSKRGSGLLKFWHEVGRGARGIIFRTPKKNLLTPQGHSLDICGLSLIHI